jgi:hypothetical protein
MFDYMITDKVHEYWFMFHHDAKLGTGIHCKKGYNFLVPSGDVTNYS